MLRGVSVGYGNLHGTTHGRSTSKPVHAQQPLLAHQAQTVMCSTMLQDSDWQTVLATQVITSLGPRCRLLPRTSA
ncbi:hypothetical protein HaLaN_14945 [Haematococcus lacustris]|uniref:Uncharacterized protein n=1 Tax=Haematococcus lacustris TaxID=44745 RepID=A0A699Z6D9_HAELA|nr:hypothetical protein HaLaN_14945 [Haematococcus lacustris]